MSLELGFLPVPNMTTPAVTVEVLPLLSRCTVYVPFLFFSILQQDSERENALRNNEHTAQCYICDSAYKGRNVSCTSIAA